MLIDPASNVFEPEANIFIVVNVSEVDFEPPAVMLALDEA